VHKPNVTRNPADARKKPTVSRTSEAQRPTSNHGEKAISQMWHRCMHAMLTLTERSSRKLQSTLV